TFAMALSGGQVYAWGGDSSGELGNGAPLSSATATPQPVPGASSVTAIDAGAAHALAITTAGNVLAWGSNDHGQVGNGSPGVVMLAAPSQVVGLGPATAIAAGYGHSLAISLGQVFAWGDNAHGQLGIGTKCSLPLPQVTCGVPVAQAVSGTSGASAIAAGSL